MLKSQKKQACIDTYFYIKYHTIITLLWKRLIRRLNTLKVKIILVFRLGVQLRPRVILGTGMCQKFQDFLLQLLQLGLLKFRFFSYKRYPSWMVFSDCCFPVETFSTQNTRPITRPVDSTPGTMNVTSLIGNFYKIMSSGVRCDSLTRCRRPLVIVLCQTQVFQGRVI